MRIEHTALSVPDPDGMGRWYAENLGMRIVKAADRPVPVRFLADEAGAMLEIYNNPKVSPPDYASMDPLLLHVAFRAGDVPATRARLIAAGATPAGEIEQLDGGAQIAMLRDPWGVAIQLTDRPPME